ncbi:MAG: RNA polymerase sigma factor [Candidatus Tectomicrobia bacterium]|uniref:RNA polymerase sigma factor n=1 Tax=Tectimicrobiota bacterium TaxID=2528274 RepID=A0A932FY65_UNCTE|nr:RNA polymerase sigma factor [Candidatus Tectomicrobia bacterium]
MKEEEAVVPANPMPYEELYQAHSMRVRQLCRLLLADPHEAEDVAQEVFLKLFREHQAQDRPIAWGPWLTRVTLNACRDRRRSGWWQRWRRYSAEEFQGTNLFSRNPTPEEEALSLEARRHIWRSFRELSPRQQEVFVLRHLEGWSIEEVAETLGLTPGSVKQHLFRAVHHLRKTLGDRP